MQEKLNISQYRIPKKLFEKSEIPVIANLSTIRRHEISNERVKESKKENLKERKYKFKSCFNKIQFSETAPIAIREVYDCLKRDFQFYKIDFLELISKKSNNLFINAKELQLLRHFLEVIPDNEVEALYKRFFSIIKEYIKVDEERIIHSCSRILVKFFAKVTEPTSYIRIIINCQEILNGYSKLMYELLVYYWETSDNKLLEVIKDSFLDAINKKKIDRIELEDLKAFNLIVSKNYTSLENSAKIVNKMINLLQFESNSIKQTSLNQVLIKQECIHFFQIFLDAQGILNDDGANNAGLIVIFFLIIEIYL